MNIAIVYGLGQSSDGDGNGLRALADFYTVKGHSVKIYGAWDKVVGDYDRLIVHSLGFKSAVDYANSRKDLNIHLVSIEPVPDYARWFTGLFVFGKGSPVSLPRNLYCLTNYYTKSWPNSVLIENAVNTPMLTYSHVTIVAAAVKVIMDGYKDA